MYGQHVRSARQLRQLQFIALWRNIVWRLKVTAQSSHHTTEFLITAACNRSEGNAIQDSISPSLYWLHCVEKAIQYAITVKTRVEEAGGEYVDQFSASLPGNIIERLINVHERWSP